MTTPPDAWRPIPEPPPRPPDWERWAKEAEELRHKALENARGAAEKWTGTISTLLGLFSTVAIVAGPDAIKDVGSPVARWIAVVAIAIAGVLAGVAVVEGALAAQGKTLKVANLDWDWLEEHIVKETKTVREHLNASRTAAIASAITLFIAGLTVAVATAIDAGKASGGATVVVVEEGGTIRCGNLVQAPEATTVGGHKVSGVKSVVPVDSC